MAFNIYQFVIAESLNDANDEAQGGKGTGCLYKLYGWTYNDVRDRITLAHFSTFEQRRDYVDATQRVLGDDWKHNETKEVAALIALKIWGDDKDRKKAKEWLKERGYWEKIKPFMKSLEELAIKSPWMV